MSELLILNLGQDTDYSGFPPPLQANAKIVPPLDRYSLRPNLPVRCLLVVLPFVTV
jgi:hypothetical protein